MAKKPEIPLTKVQEWLQQSLLNPYARLQRPQDPGESNAPRLEELVKSSKRLSAEQHLAIYQRSYTARLRDCMSKQFSALEYALGEDLFCGFADEYLQQYPSSNYNLILLGENFEAYLEATRPDKNERVKEDWPDFMIELARFEYAINIIFEEKANENYELATPGTAEDTLQLIPVFNLFEFQFPIRWYYSAFANEEEPDLPLPQQSFCVITRHRYKLAIHDLNQGQYLFLQYLKAGLSIAQAKEQFSSQKTVDKNQLETFWPQWKEQWHKVGFFRG